MATECISPFSFYSNRCYGSDLSRFMGGSERVNHLFLYEEEPAGDYAIAISESLLELKDLLPVKGANDVFKYPHSIFFRKGFVKFRFASETIFKSFLAETEIMLEVKCTQLYKDDFYFSDSGKPLNDSKLADCLALENQTEAVSAENSYNYVKGALIGFTRGQVMAKSVGDTTLLTSLSELKNSFGGLHTRLMLDETYCIGEELVPKLNEIESLYYQENHPRSNNFDVIRLLYSDLIKVAKLRFAELQKRNGPGKYKMMNDLKLQQAVCERQISEIELHSEIHKYISELDTMKRLEEENGRAIGKTRKYFPKGSAEYDRKQQLKLLIEEFKKNNKEYNALVNQLKRIKDEMTGISMDTTEYDGAIPPIFLKISDAITAITSKVSEASPRESVDYSNIQIVGNNTIKVKKFEGICEAELEYYNILLDTILQEPLMELRPISDMDILRILEKSCKLFSEKGKTYKTEDGKCVKDAIVSFWLYKKHDPRGNIAIIESMPLLSNVIAFFTKCSDFAQIERFAVNKSIPNKEFALMLWGGLVGYASLPRTMTKDIYCDTSRYIMVQDFLNNIPIYGG